jgi:hypothetical protein
MEIQPNQRTSSLNPAAVAKARVRRPEPASDQVSLAGSAAVNRALENTPDKRVELVQRARNLVGDPTYPPRETIHRLSELLALRLPRGE